MCNGLVNSVDSLDHIYDKMPELLEQVLQFTNFQFIQ